MLLIGITPKTDTNTVGDQHTVTATITDGSGSPQAGIQVTFEVISGPNTGDTASPTTDANGEATFTYTGDGGVGTDEIQACFGTGAEKVCSEVVFKIWNAASVPNIVLTPSTDLNLVGQDHTVTATVTDGQANPLSGVNVTFTVLSGPNKNDTGQSTTDANGEATFTYTGDGGIGTDEIQACFTYQSTQVCSNVVQKEWTQENLVLSPLRDLNPVNTQHTVTATIKNLKGTPIPGIVVNFEVKTGPNAGKSDPDTTDANGEAIFTYTGDGGPGTDTIRACFTNAAGQQVCTDYGGDTTDNDAIKEWQQGTNPVCPAFSVLPNVLPDAVANQPYSQTFTGFGGVAPYTFALTSGSLPAGLSLNSTTGELSGTTHEGGAFSFQITATDSTQTQGACTGSRDYTLTVTGCPDITVTPASLPSGQLNVSYSATISASGGTSPYTFAVTSGTLPAGLSLDESTGVLSGTPEDYGDFSIEITATDSSVAQGGCTGVKEYSLTIVNPIPTISEWGMILFTVCLAGSALLLLRRRRILV